MGCEGFFFKLRGEVDTEWVFADGSYVRAHQHASGARHGEERAIGRSRGGATTKIHIAADAHGNPIDFEITEGQVHDIQMATELVERTPRSDYTVADKGYDGEYLRWVIRESESIPVIPKKINSRSENKKYDRDIYRHRHLVENLFARLKHFRGIAMRFDKLKRNYEGTLAMACAYLWLKL